MNWFSQRVRRLVLLAAVYLAAVGGIFALARWFVDDEARELSTLR